MPFFPLSTAFVRNFVVIQTQPFETHPPRGTVAPMTHRHHHTDAQPARTANPDAFVTDELLSDLLDPSNSVFDICHAHALTLDELAQATDSERFRRATLLLNHIADRREHALAPLRRERALEALDRIANQQPTTATHTETIRRAAATFAKATKPAESPEPEPATAESIDEASHEGAIANEHGTAPTDMTTNEPRARVSDPSARAVVEATNHADPNTTNTNHADSTPANQHPASTLTP